MSNNNGNKRKSGEARLRDKKKKILLESALTCYTIKDMFAKNRKITLNTAVSKE